MTDLSPAAQEVVDAFNSAARPEPHHQREALAAALRAAADHINHDWSGFNCVDALCEIAAELDPPSS
jgi:hemoglobin-like flavoprotein